MGIYIHITNHYAHVGCVCHFNKKCKIYRCYVIIVLKLLVSTMLTLSLSYNNRINDKIINHLFIIRY